jgi:predicted Zn-dependent peptidase
MIAYGRALTLVGILVALAPGPAAAVRDEGRKTTAKELSVEVQRYELANGLVVLLAPDPVSSVFVSMTFRAGTLYEPPGRSGMAHLVEHVMASGPTPETDYIGLLERRGARYFNATTDFETMQFQTVVGAAELPAALWVAADRLGSVPALIDDSVVERNRRIVLQERALRDVDAPYGLPRERLFARLFAQPHPLHGSVIGEVNQLAQVSHTDVRAFVAAYLVPANAVLTVVGGFDPEEARRSIEKYLGTLPSGQRARLPTVAPFIQGVVDSVKEEIAREPAVVVAWRFRIPHGEATALSIGAQLLSFMTDGAWGMRLSAGLEENEAESLFHIDLTVPYDEPVSAVQGDVEGFMRLLTRRIMPLDLVLAANLQLDRIALFDLDTLEGRARRLANLERLFQLKISVSSEAAAHWEIEPSAVRDLALLLLESPKVVLHARPTRPRPPRVSRR